MKRYFLSVLVVVLFLACGPIPETPEVEAVVGLGNPDPMVRACATNYVRTLPNYCQVTDQSIETWFANTSGCNDRTLVSVPSSATAIHLRINHRIYSSAVINTKTISTSLYGLSGCSAPQLNAKQTTSREFAAFANALMFEDMSEVVMRLTDGHVYSNNQFTNTGASSSAAFSVIGYYD